MSRDSDISRNTLSAQARFFRVAEHEHGLTLKALSIDTGIPYDTLRTWKAGTMMPLYALNAMGKAGYADDLLSILTEPGSREIVTPDDSGDLDRLAVEAAGFTHEKLIADADGERTPAEVHKLRHRARRLGALAAAAA